MHPVLQGKQWIRIKFYTIFQKKKSVNCNLRDWPVLTIHPSLDKRIPLANPLRKVLVPEPSRGKCRKSHEHYPWLQSWKTSERQKGNTKSAQLDLYWLQLYQKLCHSGLIMHAGTIPTCRLLFFGFYNRVTKEGHFAFQSRKLPTSKIAI